MRENLGRRVVKEFVDHVCLSLIKRGGDGVGLGIRFHLLRRSPVRAAVIERVEHDVAALFIEEPLDVLAGRVVDDGRVFPVPDLAQNLHDELGLANPGVAHDLDVLRLFALRNSHHPARFGCHETDAFPLCHPVELLRREHERTAQNAAIFHLPEPLDVLGNGEHERHNKADSAAR